MKQKLSILIIALSTFLYAEAYDFQSGDLYYNITSNSEPYTVEVTSGDYSGLTTVTIPETVTYGEQIYSVTSIGNSAFYGCSGLTSVTIPNSVTSVGLSAFFGCTDLTYNKYDNASYLGNNDNPNLLLVKAKSTTITACEINSNCKVISSSAFEYCGGLTSVTIPNSVTRICNDAFYGCSGLASVTFAEGSKLTSIGDGAFTTCIGLTSVTIPNSVTSIDGNAFFGCSGLTSVTIPNSVTSIGYRAFYGCSGLTSITIPNSVANIGNNAFMLCSGLESVNFLEGSKLTSIDDGAFMYCSVLTTITIPNSVTSIGAYVFSNCDKLNYNKYGNALYLGNKDNLYLLLVKAKSTDITECEINPKCKIIGSSAFSKCSGLTSISIPNSVTSIGTYAFYGCGGLKSVMANWEEPLSINSDVFGDLTLSNISLYVSQSAIAKYKDADVWKEFNIIDNDEPTAIKAVEVENNNKTIKTIKDGKIVIIRNGVMYDMNGRTVK